MVKIDINNIVPFIDKGYSFDYIVEKLSKTYDNIDIDDLKNKYNFYKNSNKTLTKEMDIIIDRIKNWIDFSKKRICFFENYYEFDDGNYNIIKNDKGSKENFIIDILHNIDSNFLLPKNYVKCSRALQIVSIIEYNKLKKINKKIVSFKCMNKIVLFNNDNNEIYDNDGSFFINTCISKKIKECDEVPENIKKIIELWCSNDDDEQKKLDYEFFIDFFTYCCIEGNPNKNIFIFYGIPNSGKSALIKFIEYFLGKKITGIISLKKITDENQRFQNQQVENKLLCYASDQDLGIDKKTNKPTINSKFLISLSGGDNISIERKYGNGFDDVSYGGNILIVSNEFPDLKKDDALMCRVVKKEFSHYIGGEIYNLIDNISYNEWCCFLGYIFNRIKDKNVIELKNMLKFQTYDERMNLYDEAELFKNFKNEYLIKTRKISDVLTLNDVCEKCNEFFLENGHENIDKQKIGILLSSSFSYIFGDGSKPNHKKRSADRKTTIYYGLKFSKENIFGLNGGDFNK